MSCATLWWTGCLSNNGVRKEEHTRVVRKTTVCDSQQKGPSAVVEREMQISNVKCSGLKNNSKTAREFVSTLSKAGETETSLTAAIEEDHGKERVPARRRRSVIACDDNSGRDIFKNTISFHVDGKGVEVYEVNLDEISISGVVGEGSFSEVYRGKWRGSDVAVKKLNLSKSIRASTKDSDEMNQMHAIVHSFRREISIMKELDHPNILSFVGCVFSREVQVIVTEFMLFASIVDFMGQRGEIQYNASLRDRFAHDVANGMTYLHSLNILQRDLKAENILVDESLTAKIADFGLACHTEEVQHSENLRALECMGSPLYAAPEVIRKEDMAVSKMSDVYSFGIVMWELLSEDLPFRDIPLVQVPFLVAEKGVRPSISSLDRDESPEYFEIMESCWSENPEERPDFVEISARLKTMQSLQNAGSSLLL